MRLLFVCHANVARSQIAAALCTSYAPQVVAASAGVQVDEPGETLEHLLERGSQHNPYVIRTMNRLGLDISKSRRTQLRRAMLKSYDYVISMVERRLAPEYLVAAPNTLHWDIPDPARYGPAPTMRTEEAIEIALLEFLYAAECLAA
jgi:protein-tyrosine-phosphatase